jgi:hypothetical protein
MVCLVGGLSNIHAAEKSSRRGISGGVIGGAMASSVDLRDRTFVDN